MMQVVDLVRAPPCVRRGEARRFPGATALGRAEGERFLRFCCVGGVGFCVDALLLLGFVHLLGLDPITARLPSAACGILTTFELNRRWAFRGAAIQHYGAALATYVVVQSLGLACNMAVYTACYLLLPRSPESPLVGLAAASGTAMLLNYAGASRVVFRSP